MSLARLVVTAVRVEGRSNSEVARDYQVSRRWVPELVRRYDAEGEAGLEPRSRRRDTAHRPPRLRWRSRSWRWARPWSSKAWTPALIPSPSTPAAARPCPLTGHDLADSGPPGVCYPQPHKRPKSSYVRFEADLPNERWQADLTHWALADATEVGILNVLDDHSRLLVASHARMTTKAADVVASFHQAAAAYGSQPRC
jgi:Helix-turn-helix domain